VVVMVGGAKSSNTKALFEVCRKVNPRSYLVVTEADLDLRSLRSEDTVGVTGSASTPLWLLERVCNYIAKHAPAQIVETASHG
jgi:4-hydroxy-3-methylbut-2-enyl diphosphate reductase